MPTLVVLALVLGGGYAASKVFGDKDSTTSGKSPSASASPSKNTSSSWQVGDCGGPDPDNKPDGYKAFKCSDSGATFKALEIKEAGILPGSIQCPAGTDLMIKVSISYGSSKTGGIPTNTVCGRNLSGDHPGDAGAGGGQLVKGDCVTDQAKEVPCASAGKNAYKVLDLVKSKDQCPSGTTEPMQLTLSVGRPFDVICAAEV
ncbi:hypothetical protein [Streptomyces sp. WAC06614]|uniref:hypothetical protein n=1 Tax=Streptomyces sp. WAC06614 TaxID=2487416 RepID=UPI000F76F33C|nr:hypothetical protein [Streptomyces sp. WAC06614]RSS56088.1 hypothetical protein EF918_34470 [Streptomyces sp. WAC06614]